MRETELENTHLFIPRAFSFSNEQTHLHLSAFLRANKQLVRKHYQQRVSLFFKHRPSLTFMIHAKNSHTF